MIPTLVVIAILMGGVLGACAYLIYIERKLAAYVQDRLGPNRVGPLGLLQPIADGLKFILKEDVIPAHVDKVLYMCAPAIAVLTAMMALAVVPFGPASPAPDWIRFIIAPNVDIGILYIFAIGSLSVYAIILGGWASNNKYSFLGALRASAQVISYEIPLGMSILGVVLLTGSLNLERMVEQQSTMGWFILYQPLAGLIFFTAALAENNRLPFDLSECEQELVGGFHTEYSAMKFAMFFLGEYTHMITISFLVVILFFGGWHFPGIAEAVPAENATFVDALIKIAVICTKVLMVILVIMLLRWSLPRFRFDQLMGLTWKVMIPVTLLNFAGVMVVKEFDLDPRWLLAYSALLFLGTAATALRPAAPLNRVLAPLPLTSVSRAPLGARTVGEG